MTSVIGLAREELLRYTRWHEAAYRAPAPHAELVELAVGQGLSTEEAQVLLDEEVSSGRLSWQTNEFTQGYTCSQAPGA